MTRLRVGILSFAHLHAASYAHALRLLSDAQLVGIADWAMAHAPDRKTPEPVYVREEELLAARLDAAIVTSENARHRKLVEMAADAGVKAILCEKPLATTLDDAQAMIAYCAERGVKLATAFPCRYSPAYQRLRAQVQSGAIGQVLAIRGTNRGSMPGGWFTDRALSGGGAVIDHTVHVADLNRFLLGREATEVYAEIGNGFFHQEWDDTGFLTIKYGGDVFATLDTSWSRPKTYPTWGDVTMEVVGSEGVLNLDLFAQHVVHYNDHTGHASWPFWGSNIDSGMVADFVRLARGEEVPTLATGEDGLRALEIALAAYRSAEINQAVTI